MSNVSPLLRYLTDRDFFVKSIELKTVCSLNLTSFQILLMLSLSRKNCIKIIVILRNILFLTKWKCSCLMTSGQMTVGQLKVFFLFMIFFVWTFFFVDIFFFFCGHLIFGWESTFTFWLIFFRREKKSFGSDVMHI